MAGHPMGTMCAGDFIPFSDILDEGEKRSILDRACLFDSDGQGLTICVNHRQDLGNGFRLKFVARSVCLWPDHPGVRKGCRNTRPISRDQSKVLYDNQKITVPMDARVCLKCSINVTKKLNDPPQPTAPMDEQEPESQQSLISSNADVEDPMDADFLLPSQEARDERRLALNDLLQKCHEDARLTSVTSIPVADLGATLKYRLRKVLAQSVAAVIHTVSNNVDDDSNIWKMMRDNDDVQKHLQGVRLPTDLLRELIESWNSAADAKLRRQILSIGAGTFGYAFLSKFNQDTSNPEPIEDNDDEDIEELCSPQLRKTLADEAFPRFNPKLTEGFYQGAKRWYLRHGHGGVPVPVKKKYVWRFDPIVFGLCFDFLTDSRLLNDVAFGTITRKDDAGNRMTMPKLIRLQSNAELVRQLTAFISEQGLQPPSESSLFRLLRAMPAGKQSQMKGKQINSISSGHILYLALFCFVCRNQPLP